jgi:hypothetical protein
MAKIANGTPFWTGLRDLPELLIIDGWSLLPEATLLIPEAGHRRTTCRHERDSTRLDSWRSVVGSLLHALPHVRENELLLRL